MTTRSFRVLVTGVGGRSVGNGIRFALGLLPDRYVVHCTDADAFSFGLYVCAQGHVVPSADDPEYAPALCRLIEDHRIDAVFPGTIPEVEAVSGRSWPVPMIMNLNRELVDCCRDKLNLYRHLVSLHIDTPLTVVPEDVERLIDTRGFPFLIKPRVGTGGSRNVALVADQDDLAYLRHRYDQERIPYLFQEVVGTGEDEYTVGVIHDKEGQLVDSLIIRRRLSGLSLNETRRVGGSLYHISSGYSQGYVIRDDALAAQCEAIAGRLGNVGPMNLQLRIHAGRPFVFEVHPRFSGTTPLRASVGLNEPDLLFRNYVLDERLGRVEYQRDVAAIRAFEHVIVPARDLYPPPSSGK
jgi:carbamoyl-phosphate synthase large subunit